MRRTRSIFILALVLAVTILGAGCTGSSSTESVSSEPAITEPASTATPIAEPATATPVPAPAAGAGREPAPESFTSIRDVDFNNFTYSGVGFEEGIETTVVDGRYMNGESGDEGYYLFAVSEIDYGDLDGDGIEDALVTTFWNGGGTGYFDSVRAFRLVDGVVATAGEAGFGDRADGGVHDIQIVDGVATVWSYAGNQGACCPNRIVESQLVLGEYWLVEADRSVPGSWISLQGTTDQPQVFFEPDTSSGFVSMYGNQVTGSFLIEASQGQRLSILLTSGPAPADISVTDPTTGQVFSGLASTELPSDAVYEITVSFDDVDRPTSTLEVVIDGEAAAGTVQWMPVTEQVLISEEPLVRSMLVWPTFTSPQPGTDAANTAFTNFVTDLDDFWLGVFDDSFTPLDDSSSEIVYEVTLVTNDLVSVKLPFYDYVCCYPYPNYGQHGAVLDLAAGRLIPDREILDVDRVAEIQQIWLAQLAIESPGFAEAYQITGEGPALDSINLVPGGVELGTNRNGPQPGTTTVLTLEQLGDLAMPEIRARLSNS